jgi:ribosomal protein S18 acetylase RimI-like enzyme
MMSYKQAILELNYCLYARLTKTVLVRDDCVIALNPLNKEYYQSNLCYRIRLKNTDISAFIQETRALFDQVGCDPRYHLDDFSEPSLPALCDAFTQLGYKAVIDTDVIMSWKRSNVASDLSADIKYDGITYIAASLKHLDCLTRIFAIANGYDPDSEWLCSKLKTKLQDPQMFPIVCGELDDTGVIVCAVILHMPPGLPHLGHVNVVATDPAYQRKGYSSQCLAVALDRYCGPQQTFYLEVYDYLHHAQRMYERLGFKREGLLNSTMIALD